MKKCILFLAFITIIFSCSKDNLNIETDLTTDLSQMTPNKLFEQSSQGMYYGVFGHSSIKDLHGKIYINAGNNGSYSAIIQMVNGNNIRFTGNYISDDNIHFISNRGSFDFNVLNFSAPEVSNVYIDQESEAYIVVKKSTRLGGGLISIGSYEETENESEFWGNFDMFGEGFNTGLFLEYSEYISQVVISHMDQPNPYIDLLMESTPQSGCFQENDFPVLVENENVVGGIFVYTIIAEGQKSHFAGSDSFWSIKRIYPEGYYDNNCNLIGLEGSGSWKWKSRKGKIY